MDFATINGVKYIKAEDLVDAMTDIVDRQGYVGDMNVLVDEDERNMVYSFIRLLGSVDVDLMNRFKKKYVMRRFLDKVRGV